MRKILFFGAALLTAALNVRGQGTCATAVNITVKANDRSCFTGPTHVATVDVGSAVTPPGGCSAADDNQWWGKFTATCSSTELFMWGKDKDNASIIIYSGTCAALTQVHCVASTSWDDFPTWGTFATTPGQTYYILIHKKMTSASLCLYCTSAEPAKPVCTAGMSFEDGVGAGWVAKYGGYHLVSAPSNNWTWNLPNTGTTSTPAGRFTVTSGTGRDIDVGMLPVVAPGGGNYSFRLGNHGGGWPIIAAVEGFAYTPPGQTNANQAGAESMTYCFTVSAANAGFGYKYATVMDAPQHEPVIQPLFEVYMIDQSLGDTVPCGRYLHYPADGKSPFNYVGNDGDVLAQTDLCFTPWTDVMTDLTGYVGKTICVTFRAKDCSGNNNLKDANGNWTDPGAGSHGAYGYFDTYCQPLKIDAPVFCAGTTSIQICAPAGYLGYSWPAGQPGLSGSPTTQCVTISNPVAGTTYTVNLTSFSNCPTKTTVTLQGANLQVNSTTICSGQPTTLTATGGTGYSWSTGATSSSITVSPTATTTYSVTASAGSCSASGTATVTVGTMAATISPAATICPGGSATITSSGGGTYSWSNGATSSSIIVTPGSTTTYSVTVSNGGCQAAGTTTVTVAPITASVTPPASICSGAAASITATGGGNYSWSNGSTTATINVTPTTTTTYTVLVSNSAGCTSTASTTITVNSAAATVTPPTTVCPGTSVTLTSTGGGNYSWTPGGSTSASIAVAPTATTSYTVTVSNANCSSTATTTITVNNIASANVSPPSTICPGGSVTLSTTTGGVYSWSTGETTSSIVVTPGSNASYSVSVTNGGCQAIASTSVTLDPITAAVSPATSICLGASTSFTASGGTSYSWSDGSTTASITITPTASGTYSVIVSNSTGCTDVASTNVTVNSVSPTITAAVTICINDIATITAGGGGTYSWSNGSATPAISVSPSSTTTYSVTVTNGGCSSTLSQTVTVNPYVVASVNAPPSVCLGSSVTLIATGGNSYSWSTGATSPTIVITPAAPGSTTYSVTVSSGTSCIDDTTVTITANPLPTPTISAPVTICTGTTVQFTAGGGSTYTWSNGATGATITLSPTANGTYSVLVVDANGCTGTASTNVTVAPIPNPTVNSSTICAGASATLTANGGGTYSWSNGQTGPSIVVNPGSTTSYAVTVSSANGCTASANGTITVVPSPTAVFSNSAPCEGASVSFLDGSLPAQGDPIQNWSWSLPGGSPSTSAAQHPSSFYAVAGTYTASLVITSIAGCKDTVNQTVIVYANPVALFAGNDSACASLCHTFSDGSQAVNGTITGWYWTFPGGNPSSSTAQNPTICYNTPGSYGASLQVTTNYGCKDTFALTPVINVYSVPTADFCVSPLQASITDPTFKFCDLWTSDVTTWFWSFGDGDSDRVNTDPTHSYTAAIINNDFYSFNICLNVRTAHGCWDTICKTVELIPEFTFYIPNTFTPNGDGYNDFFFGKGRGIKKYEIWIFDRWGNLMWDCQYEGANTSWDVPLMEGMSSACKWNGVVETGGPDMSGDSGSPAQQDVYVWKVQLVDIFDKKHSYVGHVNIVK